MPRPESGRPILSNPKRQAASQVRFPLAAVFMLTRTVRTGSSGRAGLQFHDQSNLSVGPSSQVRLDKFVYDPNKGTGSTVIEATRGTFRFTTGSQNKGEVKIKTPYGTLGTRG
jgi:hypothetical protein